MRTITLIVVIEFVLMWVLLPVMIAIILIKDGKETKVSSKKDRVRRDDVRLEERKE